MRKQLYYRPLPSHTDTLGLSIPSHICNMVPYRHEFVLQNAVLLYSVSTYFRLEFIEPSAREVEGQQFSWALTLYRVSLCFGHVLFSPRSHLPPIRVQQINTSLAGGSIYLLCPYSLKNFPDAVLEYFSQCVTSAVQGDSINCLYFLNRLKSHFIWEFFQPYAFLT